MEMETPLRRTITINVEGKIERDNRERETATTLVLAFSIPPQAFASVVIPLNQLPRVTGTQIMGSQIPEITRLNIDGRTRLLLAYIIEGAMNLSVDYFRLEFQYILTSEPPLLLTTTTSS